MATCGANLHGVTAGALSYAMGSKRAYPVRVAVQGGSNWSPAMIYNGNPAFRAYWSELSQGLNVNIDIFDDRKILRTFMSLKSFVDPLTGKVDYEAADDDSNIFSSISLWFGFGIKGQKALNRMGDRWTWLDKKNVAGNPAGPTLWSFNVIAGDTDIYSGGAVQSSHPDDAGMMANYAYQNTDFRKTAGFKCVASLWEVLDPGRGLSDLNFAITDGSVSRYNGVAYKDPDFPRAIPYYNTIPGWSVTVPGRP